MLKPEVLLASQLTVISMHLLWNQDPQHPKNATMKTMTPTAIQRLSALIMLYLGSSWAYPAYESRSQIPTPRIPQPQSWNKTTVNPIQFNSIQFKLHHLKKKIFHVMLQSIINTYVSLMYELKTKMERYLRVNLLGPWPSSCEKTIYRAAVSWQLRNSALEDSINNT